MFSFSAVKCCVEEDPTTAPRNSPTRHHRLIITIRNLVFKLKNMDEAGNDALLALLAS